MAQILDSKEIVTLEELAKSNMLQLEALYKLLLKKGIITKKEYIDEMQELRQEMTEKGERWNERGIGQENS